MTGTSTPRALALLSALALLAPPVSAQSAAALSIKDGTGAAQSVGGFGLNGKFYYGFLPTDAGGNPVSLSGLAGSAMTVGAAFGATALGICAQETSSNSCMALRMDYTNQALLVSDLQTRNAVGALASAIAAPDARPAAQTIAAADTASTASAGNNNVAIYAGTPTANSFAGFKPSTSATALVQLSGNWTGTVQFERAMDNAATGGTNWQAIACHQQGWAAPASAATGNGIFECATAGSTGFRVRATSWTGGSAAVAATFTPQASPRNPTPQRITDGAASPLAVGAATVAISSAAAATTQLVAPVPGKAIYVTADKLVAGGATSVSFSYGATCGAAQTALTGAIPLVAQAGWVEGSGLGAVMVAPAGNALCLTNAAAAQVSGSLTYAQF